MRGADDSSPEAALVTASEHPESVQKAGFDQAQRQLNCAAAMVENSGMQECGLMQSCGIDAGSEPREAFDFLKDFDEIVEVLSPGCLEGLEPPAHSHPVAAYQAGRRSPTEQSAFVTSAPTDLRLTFETNGTYKAQRSAEANRAHQKKFRQRQKVHLDLQRA